MPALQFRSLEFRVLHLMVIEQIEHRCPGGHRVSSTVLMGHVDPTTYGQRLVTCRGGCCSLSSPRLNVLQRVMVKQKVETVVNLIKVLKLVGNPTHISTAVVAKKRTADEAFRSSALPNAKRQRANKPQPHPSLHKSPGVLLVSGSDQVLGGGEERRESRRDEHSSGPERATPRETGDRRSGQTGKRRRQARGLRVSESGAIDRNGSGTEGTRGSLRIRKWNGQMSGPKSIPKVSWMAEGFGSGPEARECSGTRDMGWKRAEASRSSVARRRRQGDGIEQRWDGWGSVPMVFVTQRHQTKAAYAMESRVNASSCTEILATRWP
ncbi:hypothetical protein BKA70DRAFT_1216536 [Coprinopsis sp. MPI-PUGE-AT-0042]|nr:hypothetical protein BKA70DRAFT_1216536 [Coprinopsis sp. MPI-PUGE-AT-0042]